MTLNIDCYWEGAVPKVEGLGFRVQGSGFSGLGGLGFRVEGLGV